MHGGTVKKQARIKISYSGNWPFGHWFKWRNCCGQWEVRAVDPGIKLLFSTSADAIVATYQTRLIAGVCDEATANLIVSAPALYEGIMQAISEVCLEKRVFQKRARLVEEHVDLLHLPWVKLLYLAHGIDYNRNSAWFAAKRAAAGRRSWNRIRAELKKRGVL